MSSCAAAIIGDDIDAVAERMEKKYRWLRAIAEEMYSSIFHRGNISNNVNCIESPYKIDDVIKKLNKYFVRHKARETHVF